ncbi:glycerophosphodiester phosphodiesterase family protein [Yoonia sp. 208BN28-4]|uniref:glycerophosphodiester phosphodiesterase family protein n=1 Tax=Yoonia sp. 208BN28-4 TaxID=3126505 RepID=UPI0030B05839
MKLDPAFTDKPITHRGLHDRDDGRPENSMAAFEAAIEHGYGIEMDLQLSADSQAMVFHDYDLGRLTDQKGPVAQLTSDELEMITLTGGDSDAHIPKLEDVLALVAGQVPLLIELKDQDGGMGPNIGRLEQATIAALESYDGPVALMSFNPHVVAKLQEIAPNIPRGLITAAFNPDGWAYLPEKTRSRLRDIPDYDATGACFISHDKSDLDRPRVHELKAQGATILCWTIKSAEQERKARKVVDNVTFEGYLA